MSKRQKTGARRSACAERRLSRATAGSAIFWILSYR